MDKNLKLLLLVNFVLYFVIVQWLLLLHGGFYANGMVINIIESDQRCFTGIWESIRPFVRGQVSAMTAEVVSFFLNIAIPVPFVFLGLYYLRDSEESFGKVAFAVILLTMIIFLFEESIQCEAYLGAFQVYDLVLYLLGAILAAAIYAKWIRPLPEERIAKTLKVTRNIMLPVMPLVLASIVFFVCRYFYYWGVYHETGRVPPDAIY